ncbi:MAG: metallophosphoesterase [Acetobacteraceae bacterium]|nr:metallophosphoesterase [Acetobacteraceae bacterium]
MRLAVISDIHANLAALEAVLADIRGRSVDATVNLGDCVGGPLWPRETWDLLTSLALPTVRGNHDRYLLGQPLEQQPVVDRFAHAALTEAQRQALFDLPVTIDLDGDVLAVHGTPTDDSTYLTEEILGGRMVPAPRALLTGRLGAAFGRSVVLCGHSHRQSLTQVPGGPLILNPGTVGCPIFADAPNAAGVEFRSPHARYAVLTRRSGRWGAEMFALEYDWDRAATQARASGFERWAGALALGAVT